MKENSRIYFISDLHLGMHPVEESRRRELVFVRWLEMIRKDAGELWLLGDVFDYWFEHKRVVPRGFTRVLGKLAELSDEGVKIHFFTGNHDIWVFDYLPGEIGMEVHRKPLTREWNGRLFLLGHGDGLWGKDGGYRLLQGIFKNPVAQWCYARLHPNGSAAFAQWWSKRSRMKKGLFTPFLGKDQEHQVQFARKELGRNPRIDFFIFGHRHIPYDIRIGEKSRVICLGDWIENYTYAVFDGKTLQLKKFFDDCGEILRM